MNHEEINKIKDPGLHAIRLKYWNLRHKAFVDEHGISDQELVNDWDGLTGAEEKEVASYIEEQGEQENG